MRKRERTRQQAVELRQMQKLFLLKAMASPGNTIDLDHKNHFQIYRHQLMHDPNR